VRKRQNVVALFAGFTGPISLWTTGRPTSEKTSYAKKSLEERKKRDGGIFVQVLIIKLP